MTSIGIFNPVRTQVPVTGPVPVTTAQPIGAVAQRPAFEGGFVQAQANPFGAPANGNGASVSSQAMSEQVYREVVDNQAARQTYKTYDHAGRDAALVEQVNPMAKELADGVVKGTVRPDQIDALIRQRLGPIEADLDARFKPVPPNPDAYQKPANAYDWQKRTQMEKQLIDPMANEIAQMVVRGEIQPDQINGILKQRMGPIEAQINQACGDPPPILTPESVSRTPGYPYEAREAENDRLLKPVIDELVRDLQDGKISSAQMDKILKEKVGEIERKLDSQFQPMPPPKPYDPAIDTKENYDQNRWQMESQLQTMQGNNSKPDQILGYKLQRQAEMAQVFPQQSMLAETREQWKAVALQMQADNKPEGEIKDYLAKKAAAYKEPTPEEMAVYIGKKQAEAGEIAALLKAVAEKEKKAKAEADKAKSNVW